MLSCFKKWNSWLKCETCEHGQPHSLTAHINLLDLKGRIYSIGMGRSAVHFSLQWQRGKSHKSKPPDLPHLPMHSACYKSHCPFDPKWRAFLFTQMALCSTWECLSKTRLSPSGACQDAKYALRCIITSPSYTCRTHARVGSQNKNRIRNWETAGER